MFTKVIDRLLFFTSVIVLPSINSFPGTCEANNGGFYKNYLIMSNAS
jgi:hypothetical protein